MNYSFRSVFLLIFAAFTQTLYAQTISDIIKEAPNQEAFWAVTVRDVNGEILESLNSDKAIIPASNQKLFTTAAILDHFGANFQYETIIYGEGSLEENSWNGNLIIKGSGDPSISGDLYEDDRYYVFDQFLNQFKAKGINKIEGDLIADISLFDNQIYPKGWDWYDFSFYYGVQISPLSFNNNAVDLEVFAEGEIGDTPKITWFPDSSDYVSFINQQVITHPDIDYDEYYRRGLGGNRIVLGSTLPKGYYETESLSIHNPPMFFLDSFQKYLSDNGIEITGDLLISVESEGLNDLEVIAKHNSHPLSLLIDRINKESDNFYAEMLTKTLSADIGKQPGTFEHGIQKIREFVADQGIDTTLVQMNDGSGLAIGNYNTTSNISDLLHKMQHHVEYEVYYNSMSVAGIDGSFSYRMKDTPLYKNFRGKSGFVTGVRTLSGYLEAKSGNPLIVSIATNNFIAPKVRPIDAVHEQILMYLYEKY